MMTYSIKISGLKKAEVLPLLEQFSKNTSFQLEKEEEPEGKPNGKGRKKPYATPDDILSLTGKSATEGSARESILLTMEKLEKKNGIGTVSRKMLREECSKKGQDSQIIYQLIREGYLRTLT